MGTVKKSVTLLVMMLALAGTSVAQFGAGSISGRLIVEYKSFRCGFACEVRLETSGMQVVDTAYVDSQGNFRFNEVRPGTYFIHAALEGFEEVRQQVDVSSIGAATTFIVLTPTSGRSNLEDSDTVHITQFLDQYPDKAVSLYKKAVANDKKGKKSEAIKQLEEAIRIAPNFYNAHYDLGVLYREAGRNADAEAAFLRAIELNRTTVEPLVNLSSLYIDDNRFDQAVEVSEEAVKRDGNSAPAFFNLGLALYKISRLDRAEEALKKAISIAPKMFQVRLLLANVYMKLERYDSLMEQLDGYLAENPDGEQRSEVEEIRNRIVKGREEGAR
jgi:Flp pilus assembly protein TadD